MKFLYRKIVNFFILFIGLAFVVGAIFIDYIWGTVFFGLVVAIQIFKLVKTTFHNTDDYKKKMYSEFMMLYNDCGIFDYNKNGFIIDVDDVPQNIEWGNIQAIFGYKIDRLTTDDICIDVFCDNNISFSISEETSGWYVFLKRIAEQFPKTKKGWEIDLVVPAFETNLTLVYEKDNRSFVESEQRYYKKE